jgi:fatty-acyl-CoA synthase
VYPGQHPGDKVAYQMATSGVSVTYAELEADSNRAANLYRRHGLKAGDGIAILMENHPEYLKVTWGAQRSGLYFTPISTLFQEEEINYILTNSDARLLITSRQQLVKVSEHILASIPVFVVDADASDTLAQQFSRHEALANMSSTRFIDEGEGAEMVYSSGTTGRPKGVRFPFNNGPLGSVSDLFRTRVKMHAVNCDTRYLSTAPLYHSAPLRYNMMTTRMGGSAVIMEKFDAKTALQLIERHQITHSQWVPTMFVRLLRLPEDMRQNYDLTSLQYVIHAAAPCPVDIKQQMIDWLGPCIYEYYSGTEANGSTAITSPEWLNHRGSVGRAIHGDIHILDDDLNECASGHTGTVYFANGSDFSYYKDPDKTAAAKNARGWSTLGDMGHVDEDGYLYLTDRKSFMIISGGVNIYPQEVENALINHLSVADVAVIGVPNAEFGEEVKAVVELVNPNEASEQLASDLMDFCRARISHVKCPRSIDFERQLPRHPTGKLYKRQLRDRYWPESDKRI